MLEPTRLANKGVSAVVVTPDNTTDIELTSGIYVGETGDLVVTLRDMEDGETIVFKSLSPGVVHPLLVKRVWEDTTCVDIVAVY